MSRRENFTPFEKKQACIDYINGNCSRSEIRNCLHISTRAIQDWAAIYKKNMGFQDLQRKQKIVPIQKNLKRNL